jgi:hypothetical protein
MDEQSKEAERAAFEAWPFFAKMNDAAREYAWRGWLERATQASTPADHFADADKMVPADVSKLADEIDTSAGRVDAATTSDTWPIAKLTVAGDTVTASFYTPGLPDGEHDVWPCPVALDHEAVAERAADLHDNAAMPLADALELALSEAGAAGAVPAGWVGVSEALPPAYADCWLHLSTGSVVQGSYFAPLGSWDWEGETDADNEATVLHWQRFSAPPAPRREVACER